MSVEQAKRDLIARIENMAVSGNSLEAHAINDTLIRVVGILEGDGLKPLISAITEEGRQHEQDKRS